MPQEGWIDTVKPLHDEAGRDRLIADDGLSAFRIRADFRLHMVVAVGCRQAGKSVAGTDSVSSRHNTLIGPLTAPEPQQVRLRLPASAPGGGLSWISLHRWARRC